MLSRIGQQLGNYSLLSQLGEGSFADVYLGEHVYLKTPAAIKVLHTRLKDEKHEAFLAEARAIARLKHANIVRVLEFGVEDDIAFLVMELAPSGSLRKLYPAGTRLSISELLPYVEQAAAALEYAHRHQLIHSDVKPENMLLGLHNTLLLSDFGIAQVVQQAQSQQSQKIVGTMQYMAPEQIQENPSAASDQYALGAVVYEWLAGEPPFQGSLSEIATQHLFVAPPPFQERGVTVPQAVESVVMKALAKEPEQRFASVEKFASVLRQAEIASRSVETRYGEVQEVVPGPSNTQQKQHPNESHVPLTTQAVWGTRVSILTIVTFLMVICLSMIGSSGLTYYATTVRSAQSQARETATVWTKQQQFAKQTRTAEASGYQRVYLQATSGSPVFTSSLQMNDTNEWFEYDSAKLGGCQFVGGAYHAVHNLDATPTPCTSQKEDATFDNFALQVQMTFLRGDMGGIVFRWSDSFYTFLIGQDGSYRFLVTTTSTGSSTTLLNGFSAAINPGPNQTNVVAVVARGSQIYLYVNKQYITQVKDGTSSTGGFGLIAQSNQHPTEVAFRNVQVWKL